MKLGEIFQNLGHFISALAAADVDNDVRVGPLGNLVLGHGFARTKSAGNGCCTAFCNGEQSIQNTLSRHQRLRSRVTLAGGTGNTDRPFLCQFQRIFRTVF